MTPFLAIDPGKATGWALFDDMGRLQMCGLAREKDKDGPFSSIPKRLPLLVIERPHQGESKATKSDIITLSRRMGMAIAAAAPLKVKEIEPNVWKGNVPKKVETPAGVFYPALEAIKRRMTPSDQGCFILYMQRGKVAAGLQHNVLDAVGIGIWYARTQGLRS